jgi:glycosyltransferase involved in cell wall biosynthesis
MTGTIVHVGSFRPNSANGVHQAIAGQARALVAASEDVEIWHFQQRVEVPTVEVHDGLRVVHLPQSRPIPGGGALSGLLRLPTRTSRAWVADRLPQVRLFHFHSVFQPENLWLSHLGLPYVLTPHGGYSPLVLQNRNMHAKRLIMKAVEGPFVRRAQLLQAVSDGEAAELRALSARTPVVVIPNGVSLPEFGALSADRRPIWLYIGRLAVEHKGLDLLLRGYALALARNAHLPHLVMAGPDFRGGFAKLKRMVSDMGLQHHVSFPGALDDVGKRHYMSQASLFVHTSRWDGLPIAALEALAAGVPLLVTPGTNLADVVAMESAGYATDADPQHISDRLLEAVTVGKAEHARQRRNARTLAEERFSWSAVADSLSSAYAEHC